MMEPGGREQEMAGLPRDGELLRGFLAGRDVACPGCGYNLRGLEGSACPECDQQLELRVNLVEPRPAEFITGLVGLSVGIGFSVAFLSYVAIIAVVSGASAGMLAEAWPLPLNLVVEVGALVAWVRLRHRLRRLAPGTRRLLVAGCWVLSAALAGLFFSAVIR